MSEAMKVIVGNYVRLGKDGALKDLRDHRNKLLTNMRFNTNDAFDVSFVTDILETEIAIIDDGLAALTAKPSDDSAET